MIVEMEAMTGFINPPLTFGELRHACLAKVDFQMVRQSELMAHISNCAIELMGVWSKQAQRIKRRKPEDFYQPQLYRRKRSGRMGFDGLEGLKAMFTKPK